MSLLIDLFRQMRAWDTAPKIGLALAGVLLVSLLGMAATSPEAVRNLSLFSAGVLLIVMQGIVMWGNRNMVVPYTQAQRQFRAGDFEGVRDTVLVYLAECEKRGNRPAVDALTLLGNAYRSLGQPDESEKVLTQAVQIKPSYYFPLYGLGRTLLVKGNYEEAVNLIQAALNTGAPRSVLFDLGHALYRLQRSDAAGILAQVAVQAEEAPHRQLMARYWLNQMPETGGYTLDAELVAMGLPFWKAEVERFAQTPYGQVLQRDLLAPEFIITGEITHGIPDRQ